MESVLRMRKCPLSCGRLRFGSSHFITAVLEKTLSKDEADVNANNYEKYKLHYCNYIVVIPTRSSRETYANCPGIKLACTALMFTK